MSERSIRNRFCTRNCDGIVRDGFMGWEGARWRGSMNGLCKSFPTKFNFDK